MRQPLGEPYIAELWQPGELDRPRLTIVGDEELVIGKLCALLDRCAARDVWDVANFRAQAAVALDLPSFRRRFMALAGTLDHPPDTYTERRLAERTTQREVDEPLVPMLATGARVQASDVVAAAWSRLAPLLALTAEERRFVEKPTEVTWTPLSCSRTMRRRPRGSTLIPRCDGRPRMPIPPRPHITARSERRQGTVGPGDGVHPRVKEGHLVNHGAQLEDDDLDSGGLEQGDPMIVGSAP